MEAPDAVRCLRRGSPARADPAQRGRSSGSSPTARSIELPGFLALVANAGELVPGRLGPRHRIDPADGRLDLIVLGGTHVRRTCRMAPRS